MSYTPKFQAFMDELEKKASEKKSFSYINTFFKEEMQRLGPYERLNNLYKVRPKKPVPGKRTRYVSFRMNEVQEEYWKNKTTRDTILKMRQVGTTTLSCLIGLDMSLFNPGSNACIMAHVLPNVKKYFRITKNAFIQFQKDWGDFYPVTNIVDNVSELHIGETGSIMMVATETKGLSLDFLHFAEAAFIEDSRLQESLDSVPLSSQVIFESTANGAAGLFYEGWNSYLTDPDSSLFKGHFFPWWRHYPEKEDIAILRRPKELILTDKEEHLMNKYDLTETHVIWRRAKISEAGGSEAEFLKKYPEDPITCFLSGAKSIFDAETVRSLWVHAKDPSFRGDLSLRKSQI